jgi:hypothetical protein
VNSPVAQIRFDDHVIVAKRYPDSKEPYVAVEEMCGRMGLFEPAQADVIRARFPRHFREEGDTLFLAKSRVLAWLATIDPRNLDPRRRPALERYQDHRDEVLDRYGWPDQSAPGPAPLPPDPLDALAETVRLLQQQRQQLAAADHKADEAMARANSAFDAGRACHGRSSLRAFIIMWKLDMTEFTASRLGWELTAECRRLHGEDSVVRDVRDARHGWVNSYPDHYLREAFTRRFGPEPAHSRRRQPPAPRST